MDRTEFVKQISQETGISRPDVRKVIESMEELILEIIATEDNVEFSFGKIEGFTKPPWRITGVYRVWDYYQKNGHWSDAKVGYPKCTFSKVALEWMALDPNKFFERPEERYTTKARQFRLDNNLEEIDEYKGLPEEEIVALCEKADKLKIGPMTKGQESVYRKKLRNKENYKRKQFLDLREKDLELQREAGVPEEELVQKTYEQLLEEYYKREKERQDSFLVKYPGIKRHREYLSKQRRYVDE